MIDIYQNWDVFVANMDIVPEQLDGEKLIAMVSELSRSREERELLGREAAAGDKSSLESFVNSYIPMIVGVMKKYAPRAGYHRDILMNCVEKILEKIINTLYLDHLEYNTSHYISWMVKNEVTHYIAAQNSIPKENPREEVQEERKNYTLEEMLEKVSIVYSDEKRAGLVKDLLHACRNEREQQLFSYRFGLEDGVPKTLQEAADQFGISIERARQIQSMAMRRIWGHIRRRKVLSDYLED